MTFETRIIPPVLKQEIACHPTPNTYVEVSGQSVASRGGCRGGRMLLKGHQIRNGGTGSVGTPEI